MMASSQLSQISRLVVALAVVAGALGIATNRTIDDQLGDSVTGDLPAYLPHDIWTQGTQCASCYAKPDPGLVFDHTWHDATILSTETRFEELNFTMEFTGTAVYAYCIMINTLNESWPRITNLTFSLDNVAVGSYFHGYDSPDMYVYNQLVYANTAIQTTPIRSSFTCPEGQTTLLSYSIMCSTHIQTPSATAPNSITTSTASTSSKKNLKAVIGGTVSGVAVLLLLSGVIIFCLSCRRRRGPVSDLPVESPSPTHWTFGESDLRSQSFEPMAMYTNQHPSVKQTPGLLAPTRVSPYPDSSLPSEAPDFNTWEASHHHDEGMASFPVPSTMSDVSSRVTSTASPSQVEELRQEVARLREIVATVAPLPPRYDEK